MRFSFVVSLCIGALALTRAVHAQQTNIDTERFDPAVTHDGVVNTEGSRLRSEDDPLELGAFVQYGRNTLVVVNDDAITDRFVAGRLGVDLFGSLTLAGPFALGLGLPLYAIQTGDADPSFAGLGDLRLVPKLRLMDDRENFGLALALELRAPTHTGDFSGGARNVVAIPKVIADHRFLGGFEFKANLGASLREETTFFNVVAGHEVVYTTVLGYRLGGMRGATLLGVEFAGAVGLNETDEEEAPLELLPFFQHDLDEEVQLTGGIGVGLLAGYGSPTFRLFFGLRYKPTSHDRDHDGISDSEDRCPEEAEDWDRAGDHDGCPEEDHDRDGILDVDDECPDEKEMINGFEDDDGCDDEGPARVIVEEGRIRILEKVQFEHDSAEITEDSHSILDQVALTMKANKDIKKVRVEGHTDGSGNRDYNRKLSQQRANSVRKYLVDRGVKSERLEAKGFGPDKPIESGTTDGANASNRHVEFIVEH